MSITLVYRLEARTREREDGSELTMPPSSVVEAHAWHATNPDHGGRVLFTTGQGPEERKLDKVTKIVIMTKDGSHALYADVKACGCGHKIDDRPVGYTQPSQWKTADHADRRGRWYCLDFVDMKPVNRGDLVGDGNIDVLDPISGRTTWREITVAE